MGPFFVRLINTLIIQILVVCDRCGAVVSPFAHTKFEIFTFHRLVFLLLECGKVNLTAEHHAPSHRYSADYSQPQELGFGSNHCKSIYINPYQVVDSSDLFSVYSAWHNLVCPALSISAFQ